MLIQKQASISRSKAQGLIHTGQVRDTTGTILNKPGQRYPEEMQFVIADAPPYVSRGGEKLAGAFKAFPISVSAQVVIDVGASTGGFTDCLLQQGARKVYAVDVGYGQLAWKLRQDARVVVLERCNIRHLKPDQLDEPPTFFTADCSFISLRLVLPAVIPLLAGEKAGVVLIKPQFEAGREQVGKGGVVRDPAVHEAVVASVREEAARLGFLKSDVVPSPLTGPAGNREFLAWLHGFREPGEGEEQPL